MIYKVKVSATSVHDADSEKHAMKLALQQLQYELMMADEHLSKRMEVEVSKLSIKEEG